jgi:Radical SAM superfamily
MDVILLTDIASTIGYGKYGGTYKLATELRSAGYSCQVIDMMSFFTVDQLQQTIAKFVSENTKLIGVSTTLSEVYQNGQELIWGRPEHDFASILNFAKSINPNIKTCAGGAKITSLSNWPFIDYCIIGKADLALLALMEHLTNNTPLKYYVNMYTKVIKGDDYFYSQEQFKTSQILWQPHDIILPTECLPMEIARGCIFKCGFCRFDLIGKKIGDWTKTADTIREEMQRNYDTYGIKTYMFTDELINESMPKLEMLANAISRLPFKIQYSSYARVDLIHKFPDMREMLAETGAASLTFGIETFNHAAGKAIGKGLHPDRVKETLAYCKKTWHRKVLMSSGFLVGLPEEDEASIYQTLEYLLSDQNPLDVFMFAPLHMRHTDSSGGMGKSRFELDPEKFGYKIEKDSEIWTGKNLSYTAAQDIVQKIYQDPRMKTRGRFKSASYLGRIMSLGYSIQDIFAIIYDMTDDEAAVVLNNIRQRVRDMKGEYLQKLMQL